MIKMLAKFSARRLLTGHVNVLLLPCPRKVDATSLASAPRSGRLLDRRGAFFDNHYHVEGAEPSDLHAQDVGNVVLLEHINLEVRRQRHHDVKGNVQQASSNDHVRR